MQMPLIPPSSSSSSSSQASADSNSAGTSNLSNHIESLRQRIVPLIESPAHSNPNTEKRQMKPIPSGSPSTRKREINIPASSAQPASDLTSDFVKAKYEEIVQKSGVFYIDGEQKQIEQKDFVKQNILGSGSCGTVYKMEHKSSKIKLAVKVMTRTASDEENKRIIVDLDVLVKSDNCPFIVRCLGYFIGQAEVWICMELMKSCFEKLLKLIQQPIPEYILGKLAFSTVTALSYLKEKHGMMHRDVKPSNILIDEQGNIKLCDFGISGALIDSMAKSKNVGCAAYMSPERINSSNLEKPEYDVRADIWSLGISLIELATNSHPYSNGKNDFVVMSHIVMEDPPQLPTQISFSDNFRSFVNTCLIKNYQQRPKYGHLMLHPFFIQSSEQSVNVAEWYQNVTAAVIPKKS